MKSGIEAGQSTSPRRFRSTLIWLSIGGAALMIVGLLKLTMWSDRDSKPTAAASDPNEQLQRRVGRLEAQLASVTRKAALTERVKSFERMNSEDGPSRDAPSSSEQGVDEVTGEVEEATDERGLVQKDVDAKRDFGFSQEVRDKAWAAETESWLVTTLSSLANSRLSHGECRQTTCRLEFVHDSQQAQEDFSEGFQALTASKLPKGTISHHKEGGVLRTIVWAKRDGDA